MDLAFLFLKERKPWQLLFHLGEYMLSSLQQGYQFKWHSVICLFVGLNTKCVTFEQNV